MLLLMFSVSFGVFNPIGTRPVDKLRIVYCYGVMTRGVVEFLSPSYPSKDKSPRICNLIIKPPQEVCGIRYVKSL